MAVVRLAVHLDLFILVLLLGGIFYGGKEEELMVFESKPKQSSQLKSDCQMCVCLYIHTSALF